MLLEQRKGGESRRGWGQRRDSFADDVGFSIGLFFPLIEIGRYCGVD